MRSPPDPSQYVLPCDDPEIFRDRLLVITGVGRSGTSILGKLIASHEDVFYLYEPAAFRLLAFLAQQDEPRRVVHSQLLRSVLFEDFFLQVIHGRAINFNPLDESCVERTMDRGGIEERWRELRGRSDVLAYLEERRPLLVVKSPEFQPLCPVLPEAFPGCRVLHIERHGNAVLSSSLGRGWYSDAYLRSAMVDWLLPASPERATAQPFYLDAPAREIFSGSNATTRSACVWRCLQEAWSRFRDTGATGLLGTRYEDLVADPVGVVASLGGALGLTPSPRTEALVEEIRGFRVKQHPSHVAAIASPERERFLACLEASGYAAP